MSAALAGGTAIPFIDNIMGHQLSGRRLPPASAAAADDHPLLVALHGGTYSSAYFDVPGLSLLERAHAVGVPAIALDRPGYGHTPALDPAAATIVNNAEVLDPLIGEIWRRERRAARGVLLVGHSIGAAIAIAIAARHPSWPLLGLAVSGLGLATSPPDARQEPLPDLDMIEMPAAAKDQMMFGPDWTFDASAPHRSRIADAPVPRMELVDITMRWHAFVHAVAARVEVPVHYRQGEFDKLWINGADQVEAFAGAFSRSPRIDAQVFGCAGHCIDFHRLGAAFHQEQLSFALRCCLQAP